MRKKVVRIIKSIVLILLCLAFVIIVASIVISKVQKKPLTTVFGYGACFVISGSMEPTILINDIIIVKEGQAPALDDIVLYQRDGDLVVHRVVKLLDDGETIVTRGDANNTDDDPLNRSEIVGKVIFVIPKLGQLIAFFKSPYGIIALVSLCIAIYIVIYLVTQTRK